MSLSRAPASLVWFSRYSSSSLDDMTFEERQDLLRLVVEGVMVDNHTVRIETSYPLAMANCVHVILSLSKGTRIFIAETVSWIMP